MAVGFAVATFKTALIAHPVLRYNASGVTLAGFVELREESQHTDRFVLRVERIEGNRIDEKPAARAALRQTRHGAAAGRLCRGQGAARSAAAAARARQLRFCPRSVFPAHRRLGFCPRRDQDRRRRRPRGSPAARGCRSCNGCATRSTRAFARCLPGDIGSIASMLITGRRDAISASLRRHVRLRHRPRAVDLRLSHGGRRRRRVLYLPRGAWH